MPLSVLLLPDSLVVVMGGLGFVEDEEGFALVGSEDCLAFVEDAAVATLFVVVDVTFLVPTERTVGRAAAVKTETDLH